MNEPLFKTIESIELLQIRGWDPSRNKENNDVSHQATKLPTSSNQTGILQPWRSSKGNHGSRWCLSWCFGHCLLPMCTSVGAILAQACWLQWLVSRKPYPAMHWACKTNLIKPSRLALLSSFRLIPKAAHFRPT